MAATRRGFLTGLAAPLILNAAGKSGSKNQVAGTGAHTYEVIHDWGELPPSIAWGNTHGVVEDSQGQIYVHHTVNNASQSADTMVVFDAKGKFGSLGQEFRYVAHRLSIRKEGVHRIPLPFGQFDKPATRASTRNKRGHYQGHHKG